MLTFVYYLVIAFAIITMMYSLWLAQKLRRITRGGKIGRVVNVLTAFIILFTAGYLLSPLFPSLPRDFGLIVMAMVFLLGALFVSLVLWIIKALIGQVFKELKL